MPDPFVAPKPEMSDLPEPGPTQRRDVRLGVVEKLIHTRRLEQPALARTIPEKALADGFQDIAAQVLGRGNREATLRPIDALRRDHRSSRLLEQVPSFAPELEFPRDHRGKLDPFVVAEGHTRFTRSSMKIRVTRPRAPRPEAPTSPPVGPTRRTGPR